MPDPRIWHEDAWTTIGEDADGTVRVKLRKRPEDPRAIALRVETCPHCGGWRNLFRRVEGQARCVCEPCLECDHPRASHAPVVYAHGPTAGEPVLLCGEDGCRCGVPR